LGSITYRLLWSYHTLISGPDGLDYSCIRTKPPDFLKALEHRPRNRKKFRIAWSFDLDYGVNVDPSVRLAFEAALHVFEELGHELIEATPATGMPFDAWDVAGSSRNYIAFGSHLENNSERLTDYVRKALECGHSVSGVEVAQAWAQIEKTRGVMLDFFEKYDLLLTPTTAVPTFPIGQKSKEQLGRGFIDWGFFPFNCIFNLTRNPAATVPCGFSSNGLPIGLQIVGRIEDEITVLCASADFEEARPWADKYPPIS